MRKLDNIFSALKKIALHSALIAAFVGGLIATPDQAQAGASRIKDIASIEGIRNNYLVGYGLVVGLNATGDSLDSAIFTRESLVAMLERLGVQTRADINDLDTDNIAAVMVTAILPPFARQGTNIDVTVSTMGDSSSLLGGNLMVTPLLGADGNVYAVSQGPVSAGGFVAVGAAEAITKGVPTTGRIPNGAIIEREIGFELAEMDSINLALHNPDLTTARRVAEAINAFIGEPSARAIDPTTISLNIPMTHVGNMVGLLTDIEQLRVEPDQLARVVIDETSGTIVIGQEVRIDSVAIAQGNLTVTVTESQQVSQPLPFSTTGTTQVVDRTNIQVDEGQNNKLAVLNTGVTLQALVNGLNSLGIGPRDMITILQTIKAAGALQAKIEVL